MNLKGVKTRFAASLGANAAGTVMSFAAGLLLARGLGPAAYGSLAFLIGSFAALKALSDLGTSSAFYTFISERPQPKTLYAAYAGWLGAYFLLTAAAITLLPASITNTLWLGNPAGIVLIAFASVFLRQQIWQAVVQTGESSRNTVTVQALNTAASFLYLAGIAALFITRTLTVVNCLVFTTLEYAAFSVLTLKILSSKQSFQFAQERLPLRDIAAKFAVYCRPLAALSAFAFLYDFADKWLLQKFAGSSQQAFYQVASQFSTVSLLATTSILNIYWKEIAEARGQNDTNRVERIYGKATAALLFATAALSGLLIPWAREITLHILGPAYEPAWPAMAVMLLYPVHQSLGQITTVTCMACRQTGIYARVSIGVMLAGIIVSYFIQAPASASVPGLGLGAVGMSVKAVAVNMISVNVVFFMIARANSWQWRWLPQYKAIAAALAAGYAAKITAVRIAGESFPRLNIAAAALCLVLYAVLMAAALKFKPELAGLSREELANYISRAKNFFA